ncbi:glutamate--tRNA ligase [Candidatus Woesearchaeota archaeon]|nr:glutamate--tRNA ligase [Candidatus Woesearchaeota archaeon]
MNIRKWVLYNAVFYNGKASQGAVIGKIIAEHPEAKDKLKDIAKDVAQTIKEVNSMIPEQQRKELESIAPELLQEKPKEEPKLKQLPNATEGNVVMRLAPEPSKYMHIGHALVFLIQNMYAKEYKGKCYLRFEDTNPEKSTKEFYESIKEDLGWLGITYDKEVILSEHNELFYEYAEKLIKTGSAYVCSCPQEELKTLRMKKLACPCRKNSAISEWKKMLDKTYKEGQRTLRLIGDMTSDNGTLRDPILFRICEVPHWKQGTKYTVWPMYDFANAIADAHWKTTHVIRSKEFELREELQTLIREKLSLKGPIVTEVGRYKIAGATTQGREIRQMIENKEITGWDDPRLVTIKALRRRGFVPQMFKELALIAGLGKTGGNIDFRVLSSINRKLIDSVAHRYFFISEPKLISVDGAPEQKIELDLHPESKKGGRAFKPNSNFIIENKDYESMNQKEEYRLMECLNLRKDKDKLTFTSTKNASFRGTKRIHWLPANENIKASVLMPDGNTIHGLAETNVHKVNEGEVIQFERFGFCRLDNKKSMEFRYTHE